MFIAKGVTQKSSSSGAQCSTHAATNMSLLRSSGGGEFVGYKYFVPPGLRKTLSKNEETCYSKPESLHKPGGLDSYESSEKVSFASSCVAAAFGN